MLTLNKKSSIVRKYYSGTFVLATIIKVLKLPQFQEHSI